MTLHYNAFNVLLYDCQGSHRLFSIRVNILQSRSLIVCIDPLETNLLFSKTPLMFLIFKPLIISKCCSLINHFLIVTVFNAYTCFTQKIRSSRIVSGFRTAGISKLFTILPYVFKDHVPFNLVNKLCLIMGAPYI